MKPKTTVNKQAKSRCHRCGTKKRKKDVLCQGCWEPL